jgi:hypothetical protein
MDEKPRCKALKVGGGRCSRMALGGSDHCWSHSTDTAEERRRFASAGGKARSRRPADELSKIKSDIKTVTAAVLRGGIDPEARTIDRGTAAVLFQGFNTLLRAVETERKLNGQRELEEQIEDLRGMLREVKAARVSDAWEG